LIMDLFSAPAAGGPATQLTHDNAVISNHVWTPDGRRIVYSSQREAALTLWTVASSGGTPERIAGVPDGVDGPAIDARGGRLAYTQLVFNENTWRHELPDGRG